MAIYLFSREHGFTLLIAEARRQHTRFTSSCTRRQRQTVVRVKQLHCFVRGRQRLRCLAARPSEQHIQVDKTVPKASSAGPQKQGGDAYIARGPALTQMVMGCGTFAHLLSVLRANHPALNAINVTAAVGRYASLKQHTGTDKRLVPEVREFLKRLVRHYAQQLDARAVANILHALATTHWRDPQLVDILLAVSYLNINQAGAQHLAITIWSLARLRCIPGQAWISRFHKSTQKELRRMNNQDLSNIIWSLASIKALPRRHTIEKLLSAIHPKLPSFNAQQISNTLHALAVMQYRPADSWMSGVLVASKAKLSEFKSEELCILVWSLGRLMIPLDEVWSANFMSEARTRLRNLDHQSLATLAIGISLCSLSPPAEWFADFCSCTFTALPQMNRQARVSILVALGRLALLPPSDWLSRYLHETQQGMHTLNGRELSNTLWALARLRVQPSADWMHSFQQCVLAARASLEARHCANIAWAASTLQLQPESGWLSALFAASAVSLPSAQLVDLSILAWAAARLQFRPPTAWLDACLSTATTQFPTAGPQSAANLLYGLACLQVRVSRDWLDGWCAAALREAEIMTPGEVAMSLWALWQMQVLATQGAARRVSAGAESRGTGSNPGYSPGSDLLAGIVTPAWVAQLLTAGGHAPEALTTRDLAVTMWGLGGIRCPPPAGWLAGALASSLRQMDQLGRLGLCAMASGMARVNASPPRKWLLALTAATVPLLHTFGERELGLMAWSLLHMRYVPGRAWLDACRDRLAQLARSDSLGRALCTLDALERLAARGRHRSRDGARQRHKPAAMHAMASSLLLRAAATGQDVASAAFGPDLIAEDGRGLAEGGWYRDQDHAEEPLMVAQHNSQGTCGKEFGNGARFGIGDTNSGVERGIGPRSGLGPSPRSRADTGIGTRIAVVDWESGSRLTGNSNGGASGSSGTGVAGSAGDSNNGVGSSCGDQHSNGKGHAKGSGVSNGCLAGEFVVVNVSLPQRLES